MVHALSEIRRVLVADGVLIDLRPLLDRWNLEVSWTGGYHEAGRATDLAEPRADDAAANAAIEEQTASGRFRLEAQESFPLFYYWDTPKEMEAYLAEEWSDVISVEGSVWRDLRSSWASAGADARVRIRMKMLISRLRKSGEHEPVLGP
jgi:hypothetical protein